MRANQYLLSTLKESPSDAEIISHQLMVRAGLIRQLASGLYTCRRIKSSQNLLMSEVVDWLTDKITSH